MCGCFKKEDAMGVDVKEEINTYWNSITGTDQKKWYAASLYNKKKFGI